VIVGPRRIGKGYSATSDWSRGIAIRPYESDPPRAKVGIDPIAAAVHDDVMMEPAKSGEILRIGRAAFGPGNDVVRLEPVSAGAAVGGASAVAVQHEPAQLVWYDP
jgi:hypothetical protein